jgi:hypothetical protein
MAKIKDDIRFHWFYHSKPRVCDGCEMDINKDEGRYGDRKEKKFYCRNCANLIGIGFDYGMSKIAKIK